MKRISIGVLAAASLALGAAGCSQNGFAPIAVTSNPSAVASCEKIADIAVTESKFDDTDAATQLTRETRNRGGNTLLVSADDAKKGTAYRCAMPSVAASGNSVPAGTH